MIVLSDGKIRERESNQGFIDNIALRGLKQNKERQQDNNYTRRGT